MATGERRDAGVAARRLLGSLRQFRGDLENPRGIVGGSAHELRLLAGALREILRRRCHLFRRRAHFFSGCRDLRRHRGRFIGGGADRAYEPS